MDQNGSGFRVYGTSKVSFNMKSMRRHPHSVVPKVQSLGFDMFSVFSVCRVEGLKLRALFDGPFLHCVRRDCRYQK